MIEQLQSILDQLEDAQDATLGLRPEDVMTHLNSAVWLTEDLKGQMEEIAAKVNPPTPEKPYGGRLEHWRVLGAVVWGLLFDDPQRRFEEGVGVHTSSIVAITGDTLETRYTRYLLGKPYITTQSD